MLSKCVTVALNYEEIKKDPQRITKIKPFINKYNWERIKFLSKKMIGKNLRKIMQQLLLIFCMLNIYIYIYNIYIYNTYIYNTDIYIYIYIYILLKF